jgi:hypothetical protein
LNLGRPVMRAPVRIDTPFPTLEETAQLFGISKARADELVRLAESTGPRSNGTHSRRGIAAKKGSPKRARRSRSQR